MALSMAVVSAIVALIMFITWRPHSQVMPTVDYSGALAMATEQAPFPIFDAQAIPAGYSITNARFESESYGEPGEVRWFVSMVNSSGEYLSLWESSGPLKKVVRAASNNAQCLSQENPTQEVIATRLWTSCEVSKPLTRSLVFQGTDYVVIASGTASWDVVRSYVSSLEEVTSGQ